MRIVILLSLLFSSLASPCPSSAQSSAGLQQLFRNPPDDSRIMMRWWWFGPAVTKSEIEREMRLMKEGGIGGFEVQPVYPLTADDAATGIKNLPFLSDEFIDALRFASEKARESGLRFDLTLGSGWPYGGPQVSISESASRLRVERVKLAPGARRAQSPGISAGEKLLAVFLVRLQEKGAAIESVREITEIKDGAARLPEGLEGSHEVQFFIASRTGMQVKRPAVGAEGFVLDHLDRRAVDNYLKKVGDRLMQAFGDQPPYAIFCDSLEVYNSDWACDFLEEFQKRRGYDLKPHLPALVGDAGAKTLAIRHDWGKTLTELLNERFLAALGEWSRRNRTLLRIQDYGVPAAALSSNAYADLPEGEGAQWRDLSATRWASSASHLYGHSVTSSETWTWLHSPPFRATPLDMKAEADRHFLQGINQLIGHGWPYTAEGVEYPGWRFYAAGAFNEKNPWWIVMADLSRYLQRLSFLLRQGRPANDVAIYLSNDDAWARFTPGNAHMIELLRQHLGPDLIPRLLEAGYNFDFFDDTAFKQVGRVEKGLLILGENKYRAVILPSVESMPLDTLQRLEEFARGGGALIATRRMPGRAPGFQATETDHQKIADLSRRMFEGAPAPGHFVADEADQMVRKLTSLLAPDARLSPAAPEVGFIHRRTPDAEVYFIANTDNLPHKTKAAFRVEGMRPEWWDPMTGKIQPATVTDRRPETVTIELDLEPYESRVLVFSRRAVHNGPTSQVIAAARELDLSADWRVTFGDGAPVKMNSLRSWTDDEGTRYYSGTVAYEKTFTLPGNFLSNSTRVLLDFGEGKPPPPPAPGPRTNGMAALLEGPVREAAVVTLNGRRAGSVWCPPYSIDVSEFLKSGENKLQIVVGNTAINHMAGRALPDYRLLNLRYGERFQPQDMDKIQPVSSGLTGPVRLVSVAR
ncbi:MAG TPA: glycosyl hydrolase [Blastocatellia bacterium]|nr:glycosyl hydrolase [Blastocatellia bacterium]